MNIHEADAHYAPFSTFDQWRSSSIDQARWQRYSQKITEHGDATEELLHEARSVASRAAAVDTGAIEGLYKTDRGFTLSVACQTATGEHDLSQRDEQTRNLIESQIKAYDHVLDFATRRQPIAATWIRELHAVMCEHQEHYTALTEVGPQKQQLRKGEYKIHPNHVTLSDGTIHSYSPVDLTPAEMTRLCDELASAEFDEAHPLLQAAYAHYGLVSIHPFADGNGRVARALGSVFTYRAASVPLLIYADTKEAYFDSLAIADAGNFQPFVNFITNATFDSLAFVDHTMQAARHSSAKESIDKVQSLYSAGAGFSYQDVDGAGESFIRMLHKEITEYVSQLPTPNALSIKVNFGDGVGLSYAATHRPFINNHYFVTIVSISSKQPFATNFTTQLAVTLPRDAGKVDDLIIFDPGDPEISLSARISDVIPSVSVGTIMNARVFAERVVRGSLEKFAALAKKQRAQSGM